jgi:hypothetical protein
MLSSFSCFGLEEHILPHRGLGVALEANKDII